MFNLGFYGSHNAAIAISYENNILEVVEVERFINEKNAALWWWAKHDNAHEIVFSISEYLTQKYNVSSYDNVIHNSCDLDIIKKVFKSNNYIFTSHHRAHAHSALCQSDFNEECLIISFDGGSDEGFFNIFLGERNKDIKKIHAGKINLAVPYACVAHFIADIKQDKIPICLEYAGKLMGLSSYGEINKIYVNDLIKFYMLQGPYKTIDVDFIKFFDKHGIKNSTTRFSGKNAMDLAASNQHVFELLFKLQTDPFIKKYPNHPIILTGGGAMNIINNSKLASTKKVFVPPNASDCGQAVGLLASVLKPEQPVDCTYIGSEVWDKNNIGSYVYKRNAKFVDFDIISSELSKGKIFGIVRGRSEHGPRALGNRSIVCNPCISSMKDILNARVKGREYYRPFAPVVRLDDVSKYFEYNEESRWMSFAVNVRPEFKDILSSVTHVDGTARVQTVTKKQNEFLYTLLTKLHDITGIGVLLNTSFNIAGKPILNTYSDALFMLDTKDIDGLILEDYFFSKIN